MEQMKKVKELTDDEILYGPALCPGETTCSHCQQQRQEIVDYIRHLKEQIDKLEKQLGDEGPFGC
jgi:hypothetical protein